MSNECKRCGDNRCNPGYISPQEAAIMVELNKLPHPSAALPGDRERAEKLLSQYIYLEDMPEAAPELTALLARVRADERERCAKVAEAERIAWARPGGQSRDAVNRAVACKGVAQRIRDEIRALSAGSDKEDNK